MPQTRRQFVRTIVLASQAAVASRLIGTRLKAAQDKGLCFVVVGDWGRRGDPNQLQVAEQMGRFAKEQNAHFVISTGDNFYDKGVTSTDDSHWAESFESVYKAEGLQVPWYAVLGNHDHLGNVQAQIDYTQKSRRWCMPARYYRELLTVEAGCELEVFFIDTDPMLNKKGEPSPANPKERETQLRWLSEGLCASRARWKMVVGHHPIYSGGVHADRPELVQWLLPILLEHKVDLYVHGHDHDLQHLKEGSLQMFCSGAGSQVRETAVTSRTSFAKSTPGFMSVELNADLMRIGFIDNLGERIYSTQIKK